MAERGQSLVEFAISLVFILFLLSGLVEFGIAFFEYVQLSDASQEGALYGSMCNCSVADITDRAVNSSATPINLKENTGVSVVITGKDKSGNTKDPNLVCEGDALVVRVSYAHKIIMPFLPQLLGVTHLNINSTTVDTVLYPLCT